VTDLASDARENVLAVVEINKIRQVVLEEISQIRDVRDLDSLETVETGSLGGHPDVCRIEWYRTDRDLCMERAREGEREQNTRFSQRSTSFLTNTSLGPGRGTFSSTG
jgi:hypothetical protein